MHKYHFDVNIDYKRGNNAGSKATSDCRKILINEGFIDLQISLKQRWYLFPVNVAVLFLKLLFDVIKIRRNSLIVVQYPLLGINRFFKYFIQILKLKGCQFCAIIHDVDSLRSERAASKTGVEIKTLSAYNAVISHNNEMTKWLVKSGYKGHIEEMGLFDYIATSLRNKALQERGNEVAFAGALNRGVFLEKLAECDLPFMVNLYGSGFKEETAQVNPKIKWFGSFSPEEIINEVQGDFGLIWDGDSIEEITGLAGHYMRYNTPHKTSLYLAAGLPVIVSKKAAVATFVRKNNIGICVENLSEISSKALTIGTSEYEQMKQNVLAIGEKLRKGYYLQRAMKNTESYLA